MSVFYEGLAHHHTWSRSSVTYAPCIRRWSANMQNHSACAITERNAFCCNGAPRNVWTQFMALIKSHWMNGSADRWKRKNSTEKHWKVCFCTSNKDEEKFGMNFAWSYLRRKFNKRFAIQSDWWATGHGNCNLLGFDRLLFRRFEILYISSALIDRENNKKLSLDPTNFNVPMQRFVFVHSLVWIQLVLAEERLICIPCCYRRKKKIE